MKTRTELHALLLQLYWNIEHGEHNKAMDALHALEVNARESAIREAEEVVSLYARNMRGAHVNTNDSCGEIKRQIIALIEKKEVE